MFKSTLLLGLLLIFCAHVFTSSSAAAAGNLATKQLENYCDTVCDKVCAQGVICTPLECKFVEDQLQECVYYNVSCQFTTVESSICLSKPGTTNLVTNINWQSTKPGNAGAVMLSNFITRVIFLLITAFGLQYLKADKIY